MTLSPTTERRIANSVLDNLDSARERRKERAKKDRDRVRRAEDQATKVLTADLFAVLDARHEDVLAQKKYPKAGSVEWLKVVLAAEQSTVPPSATLAPSQSVRDDGF